MLTEFYNLLNQQGLKALITFSLLIFFATSVNATTYPLPAPGNDMIGSVFTVSSQPNDTVDTIAERYDMGFFEIKQANPTLSNNQVIPTNTQITIPAQYILPRVPRKGIIINLAELRLYYFPANSHEVITYPIGIGSFGTGTPEGSFYIMEKIVNPTWHAPLSVRQKYAKEGITIPAEVPPGPQNPLGKLAMRLSNWTYLIHDTNVPSSVGKRSSAGCIHLYPEDIKVFFPMIALKTPVRIINEFYKIGWQNKQLFLESEQPLTENQEAAKSNLTPLITEIEQFAVKNKKLPIDWEKVTQTAISQTGIPTQVSISPNQPAQSQEPITQTSAQIPANQMSSSVPVTAAIPSTVQSSDNTVSVDQALSSSANAESQAQAAPANKSKMDDDGLPSVEHLS